MIFARNYFASTPMGKARLMQGAYMDFLEFIDGLATSGEENTTLKNRTILSNKSKDR